jgi:hypothetical protein
MQSCSTYILEAARYIRHLHPIRLIGESRADLTTPDPWDNPGQD